MIINETTTNIPWDLPPLSFLTPEQQVRFKDQADLRRYRLGNPIWGDENADEILLIVAGKVRLVTEENQSILLTSGDWIGGLMDLPGFKARAAADGVETLVWSRDLWDSARHSEIDRFWAVQRQKYLPKSDDAPKAVSGFPFVSGLNTGAACLTMVDRKSTRLNSSHPSISRMPSSA